jgi:transposase-like protein
MIANELPIDQHEAPLQQQASSVPDHARKCPNEKNDLNDKQHAAIELLLLGKSFSGIARALDIDPKTLYRWRQDELFRDTLDERRRELWGVAAERLGALVHPSLDVMERHLADRYDRAQFRAAAAILRLADLRKSIAPLREHGVID